jgi:hypothetical protein
MISRNRVIVVWTPFTVVSRSSLMSLIITFMFDPAKLQMNCASASGRINLRAEASGRSVVVAWVTRRGTLSHAPWSPRPAHRVPHPLQREGPLPAAGDT